MTKQVDSLIQEVRKKNRRVDLMMEQEGTLSDWIALEREKLKKNRAILPETPEDDFPEICEEYLTERFGEKAGICGAEAIRCRALQTADHLGGFYSPQSFQGDLFFGELLRGLSAPPSAVPLLPFGYVSIDSSTYARGLMAFSNPQEPLHLPVFPRYPAGTIATLRKGFDKALAEKTRSFALSKLPEKSERMAAKKLFDTVYFREDILSQERFPEQAVRIGQAIMESLRELNAGTNYYYMEGEAVLTTLLLRELEKDGLLSELLLNPKAAEVFGSLKDSEGKPLTSLFFRGCDDKKRDYTLTLCPDGFLRGMGMDGEAAELKASLSLLREKLLAREILPGLYLGWLILGFLRGYSFFGGIFQSLYLPEWHSLTLEGVSRLGFPELAERSRDLDFSGYISGPIALLSEAGDGAVNAGPIEALRSRLSREDFDSLLKTGIRQGHELGMFEFYHDCIPANEKKDGWYETFAHYAKEQYPENIR